MTASQSKITRWCRRGKQNCYWGLKPGRYVVLGNTEPGGGEFVIISVLDETEMINGIQTRVIEEREYEDGKLAEISRNFIAMAKETEDVFYFGEDVDYYQNGKITGHAGQWRAGLDGLRAGLYMPGSPATGMRYYIELHQDHVRYAVETFIDGKQWDVEVSNDGEVFRNTPD